MHNSFPTFVLGIHNNFSKLDLKIFQKDILTSKQGVYAAIIYRADRETCLYIGSSYGKDGIKNRIIRNHLRESYRRKDPTKPLYVMMDEPGANTFFIRLSSYTENVPTAQVLLTESVCCSIFGTFSSEVYQQVRLKWLPKVDWDHGLNRSDPLQTWRSGVDTIGNDASSYRRLRTLDNCLKSGPMRVGFHPRRKSITNGSYQFTLFDENFTIPKTVAELWELRSGSVVNVQWDVSTDFHRHPFAPMAKETDVGRRIGIRVFQTTHCADVEVEKRVRVGLPYNNRDFVWDDRSRKPETRPAELKAQSVADMSGEVDNEYADSTDWVDPPAAAEYQSFIEEQYTRWLLPYHQDLQGQGCRIYTGEYVE
ncbi:hypothetical protein V491_02913 [Pseudogymnoascus sp. VKM F-3775]|nr:hypothetical protein V491_02913 [Pseudogymnoascus sp. VKM F-3775]